MSFGRASASRRPRRPDGSTPCPCGSGRPFRACCGPVLDTGSAATADALMRSRYTAFAIGDVEHLRNTWHPRTRPDALTLDASERWIGLTIVGGERGGHEDDSGTVEFRASWVREDARGELHEVSRFVRWKGRWVYLDGDVDDGEGTFPAAIPF